MNSSLSGIYKRTSSALSASGANCFTNSLVTNVSFSIGNVTSSFNRELNSFIADLSQKRAINAAKLAQQLAINPNYTGMRNEAISLAWKYEQADIQMGGSGTVDGGWTSQEKIEILQTGKTKVLDPEFGVYRRPEGHHINNVSNNKELQADPFNIKFYKTRKEHIELGHGGDVNNPSSGDLIDKDAKLRATNRHRVFVNELKGIALSAGIGFGLGFTLSAICELAINGVSSTDFGKMIVNCAKAGIETAFVSTLGYGVARAITLGLESVELDIASSMGQLINYSVIGLSSIAVISFYQYIKLRLNGFDHRYAWSQVSKQALVSISILAVSVAAQSLLGGPAGLIVSTSLGLVYFASNIMKLRSNKFIEERLRIETIKAYKEYVLS